jgi:uncharacterized OsmC-like protein
LAEPTAAIRAAAESAVDRVGTEPAQTEITGIERAHAWDLSQRRVSTKPTGSSGTTPPALLPLEIAACLAQTVAGAATDEERLIRRVLADIKGTCSAGCGSR